MMAHAQKPDFVFRRNGRVHLNQRERQFSRLLAVEVCATQCAITFQVESTSRLVASLIPRLDRDCQDFASALETRRQSRGDDLPLKVNTVRVSYVYWTVHHLDS